MAVSNTAIEFPGFRDLKKRVFEPIVISQELHAIAAPVITQFFRPIRDMLPRVAVAIGAQNVSLLDCG
jgi:hypothetical protein